MTIEIGLLAVICTVLLAVIAGAVQYGKWTQKSTRNTEDLKAKVEQREFDDYRKAIERNFDNFQSETRIRWAENEKSHTLIFSKLDEIAKNGKR